MVMSAGCDPEQIVWLAETAPTAEVGSEPTVTLASTAGAQVPVTRA